MTVNTFVPSRYQQEIFDYLQNDFSSNVMVNAVAGSGKSTTLVHAVRLLKGSTLFLAFNKHIAEALQKKMPEADCRTNHSLGFGALREVNSSARLDNWKHNGIVENIINNSYFAYPEKELVATTARLVDLARMSLTEETENALEEMAEYYGIDYYGPEIDVALQALEEGRQMWERAGIIDYADMIYLPVYYKYHLPHYDNVLIDEAQDLSAAQLALVMRIGGRMAFVGDRSQAIFGFAGADPESINRVVSRTNALEMPLSICYRCPKSHIALARHIVPQIEPREGAPEGIIGTISRENVLRQAQISDLIISRITAPLISLCLELIGSRTPAYVRGRDIGKGLISIVNKVAKERNFRWEQFGSYLDQWKDKEVKRLSKKKNAAPAIDAMMDRYDSIWAILLGSDARTQYQFITEIEGLFKEDGEAVMLSTIHRAKGLEADRVFILAPERMPLTWDGQLDWQYQQEKNIEYVAYTRARQELWFIEE